MPAQTRSVCMCVLQGYHCSKQDGTLGRKAKSDSWQDRGNRKLLITQLMMMKDHFDNELLYNTHSTVPPQIKTGAFVHMGVMLMGQRQLGLGVRRPAYLSCTCGWEVSSADLCVSGSSEPCVDPEQTW